MRICIFGAGALGSAFGGMLTLKHDVILIGRKPHVDAIRKSGLVIDGDVRGRYKPCAFTRISGLEPPDLLLITTKAYDTRNAVRECRNWIKRGTTVLTLQNGLGNLEILEEWVGTRAFGGTTTLGARTLGPGKIRISGLGKTIVGSTKNPDRAKSLATTFRSSGISAGYTRNIVSEIWGKAIVSACVNPMTAVLRVPNGRLLESRATSRLVRELSTECESIARACGVKLPSRLMYPRVCTVLNDTAKNHSSMLQDVSRGKRTEIVQINGAFLRLAQEHALPAPLNEVLVALVQTLEARRPKQKG